MKNAEKLIQELENAGYEAYLVGGCVRDMLMGITPNDYDITTSAHPDKIIGVLSKYKVIPTGLKHGTVTVVLDDEPYEITTFRSDGEYSDHRRPDSITFSDKLEDDLSRRDFTINAMAYSQKRGLIDPFGGQADIKRRLIRAVGTPSKRFEEDALRILRGIRFESQKVFSVEEDTRQAMYEKLPLLSYVSAERIFSELKKLIMGDGARFTLLNFATIIGTTIPALAPCIDFNQHNYHHIYDVYTHTVHAVENCPKNVVVRLAALLHDIGKPSTFSIDEQGVGHFYGHAQVSVELARKTLNDLRCDNATKDTVLLLIKYHDHVIEPTEKHVRRMLSKIGEENLELLLQLKTADNLAQSPFYHDRVQQYEKIRCIIKEIKAKGECFSLKHLAVKGEDIILLGAKGPEIGKILNTLLSLVIDGAMPNEKEALLKKASKLLDEF